MAWQDQVVEVTFFHLFVNNWLFSTQSCPPKVLKFQHFKVIIEFSVAMKTIDNTNHNSGGRGGGQMGGLGNFEPGGGGGRPSLLTQDHPGDGPGASSSARRQGFYHVIVCRVCL